MAIQLGPGKGSRRVRPTMNVTPLVDVVLVLLIIFMVMTPLMTRVMSLRVPSPNQQADEPAAGDEQVVLTVSASGEIRIGQAVVTDTELPDRLRRVFAARDDQVLFFDAADPLPYGRAVEVLDRARGAGITTIAVLTETVIEP